MGKFSNLVKGALAVSLLYFGVNGIMKGSDEKQTSQRISDSLRHGKSGIERKIDINERKKPVKIELVNSGGPETRNPGPDGELLFEFYNNDIKKIVKIESSGNPNAYNKKSGARGLMQITSIVLKEWNKLHPDEQYSEQDLFDPGTNKRIGRWYMNDRIIRVYLPMYGLEANPENALAAYNAGIGKLVEVGDANENFDKLPKETKGYIKKFRAEK